MSKEFYTEFNELVKKHGLTVMFCDSSDLLSQNTSHLDGKYMFITNGEKHITLRGGENIKWPNTRTISLSRKKEE